MTDAEYMKGLHEISGSRKNEIIRAVNLKASKEEAELKGEVEEMFYNNLVAQAKEHEKKWGDWPVYEMCEIESDDPKLDIYRNPV